MDNKEFTQVSDHNAELTAALLEANKKLSLQNEEKEKRAEELAIANKELAFQMKEKERRTEDLELANQELESFSYSVSHDLRAPLRAINGFAKMFAEDYTDQLGDEAKMLFEEITENAQKMGELIDNLLEFSRLGQQQVALIPVDVKDLVQGVITELRQQEPGRELSIRTGELPGVMADRNMLKQVFVNLLSNAFKYTSKTKEVTIEIGSYSEGGHIVYYVRDNGAGFDMRYYEILFGVFQRLHSSNEFDGTGVGLALVHKIITKHGGRIWAEGEVDRGACFYVSLPETR